MEKHGIGKPVQMEQAPQIQAPLLMLLLQELIIYAHKTTPLFAGVPEPAVQQ